MNIAFFESITPYWVDLHNSLHANGFDCYYTYKSIYSYDSAALKTELDFIPHQLAKEGKNSLRIWELISILKAQRPKVVISVEFSLLTLQLIFLRPFFGYRLVTRCDDSIEMISTPYTRIHGLSRKLLAPLVDDVILCDKEAFNYYKNKYHKGIYFPIIRDEELFRERLALALPQAEEFRKAHSLLGRKIVLFVGRLTEVKNIFTAIKAMEQMEKNVTMVLVGDGELRSELEAFAKGVDADVRFVGRLYGKSLYAWYDIADVLVLPSFHETFGAVVNEALIAGCRCAVSEKAGAAGLVSSSNGQLLNPYSTDTIVSAVKSNLDKVALLEPLRLKDSLMPFTYAQSISNLLKSLSV